jgi:hypothetical protein
LRGSIWRYGQFGQLQRRRRIAHRRWRYGLSASPYGTFDRGGNVFGWTERIHEDPRACIV